MANDSNYLQGASGTYQGTSPTTLSATRSGLAVQGSPTVMYSLQPANTAPGYNQSFASGGGVVFDPILGTIRSGIVKTIAPPNSATDTGKKGQVAVDDNYLYICIAANTWVRSTLSSW